MYGAALTLAFQEAREPERPRLYAEEHNVRLPTPVAYNQAPDPPRQSQIAPIKPAHQQIAFFYDPQKAMNRGERWHILGAHLEVATAQGNGKSWTSAPKGRLRKFQTLNPMRRAIPNALGSQAPDLKGGF